MGTKRTFIATGSDGTLLTDMGARKRRRRCRPGERARPSAHPVAASPRRRLLQARRTLAHMDISAGCKRVRPACVAADSSKRPRTTPAPRRRYSGTTRRAAAPPPLQPQRKAPRACMPPVRSAPAPAPAQAPAEPMEEVIEEVIAEGAGSVPEKNYVPPAPAVNAALLEDGRCAVRIVRQDGMVQCVIINPPEWHA